MLLCTVRDCRAPLTREAHRLVCARGHAFDLARSGYVNLLQPQDRRSAAPGDTADAAAARRRLHDRGVTAPLRDAIAALAHVTPADVVIDVGCGEGFYLASLGADAAYGVDISVPAIDAAARRYPSATWLVANADRFLPFADASASLILSITARMNDGEFRRVLRVDGRLLVAVAAPDDLIELRGTGRDRVARTIDSFPSFSLLRQERVTTAADLDEDAVHDVLLSIYRPRPRERVEAMRVTFSLDVMVFLAGTRD